MTNNSFFVFFILCEIVKIVSCGNEPFDLFGLQLNQQSELENSEYGEKQEKLSPFEDDAADSEERNLKKKRLFLQDGEPQTEIQTDKYFMNGEYSSKRRNSQSKTEEQQKLSEATRNYGSNHWESERGRIRYSEEKENLGSPIGFHPREPITAPNPRYDSEERGHSEKSQTMWNTQNNYKFVNPNSDPRVGSSYRDRTFNGNIHDYSGAKDRDVLDRRISITKLNEEEMRNMNRYRNDYKVNEMRYGYDMHSNMDYNKRKNDGYWDPNLHKPEKGVIINFNTECPSSRQFNNQLVHRVIVSPKSPMAQSEISSYQFPGGGLISAQSLPSTYYF